MQSRIILIVVSLLITTFLSAQNPWELGAEYRRTIGQGYQGNIAGIRYEKYKTKGSFNIGLTYHFSVKTAYSGSRGFGMFAGYRYHFGKDVNNSAAFAGLRLLFSFENFEGKTSLNSLLMTPSAEAGYHFIFSKSFFATPSIGYGYTIKITKEYNSMDEDVGRRIIPALAAGFRF
jgi:hypothetical protein